jgi:alpha/beta superfamily hydrolase
MNQNLMIPGPVGTLEVSVTSPSVIFSLETVAIICHPHPLYGGTMQNKVVTTLEKVFNQLGFICVRFNFRGVGKSQGSFDQGRGEVDDLLAVMGWVKEHYQNPKIILAGFSFGSYVALQVASQPNHHIMMLITVAPAVNHFDFSIANQIQKPWILIQGDHDEVVPAEEVYHWVAQLEHKPDVLRFPEASHFFHGQLVLLRERLLAEILNKLLKLQ